MGRVIVKRQMPTRIDRAQPYRRRYVGRDIPEMWHLWTYAMRRGWQNRPREVLAPNLDFSFHPLRICLDCERPVKVTEYCDGNWEIINRTCRFHRYAPDSGLTSAKDHPMLPIMFPSPAHTKTHHVGSCIVNNTPIISANNGLAQSVYFLRCTGTYVNSIGQAITVGKSIRRAKVGDMKRVPVVRAGIPAIVPEEAPFEVRYANAVLNAWGMGDDEALKDTVRCRITGGGDSFKCGIGGRGVKAGQVGTTGGVAT
ncbi:hypothetical protein G647_01991 [Cladophialophora carrionii CBS 160.54]|uniref:Uncharacterized protein n=1 Tax=Cladophialophora carrionii CBS 160.54 TaxID=1279043 RepID=V9DT84_9EURO|nr:uncharacterized protein G647_01991 [Cladophialophora carrionii CBS 160.54]ETI29538.1 hypothetical protein G647_01991 [Cladophialophora carrionii CBS 160.54]